MFIQQLNLRNMSMNVSFYLGVGGGVGEGIASFIQNNFKVSI